MKQQKTRFKPRPKQPLWTKKWSHACRSVIMLAAFASKVILSESNHSKLTYENVYKRRVLHASGNSLGERHGNAKNVSWIKTRRSGTSYSSPDWRNQGFAWRLGQPKTEAKEKKASSVFGDFISRVGFMSVCCPSGIKCWVGLQKRSYCWSDCLGAQANLSWQWYIKNGFISAIKVEDWLLSSANPFCLHFRPLYTADRIFVVFNNSTGEWVVRLCFVREAPQSNNLLTKNKGIPSVYSVAFGGYNF